MMPAIKSTREARKIIRLLIDESGPHEENGETTYDGHAVSLALWVDAKLNMEREVWTDPTVKETK